jgi:hypothetical protein
MLRISHCLHNRLTDGGKVVSPTHRQLSTLHKHFLVRISVTGWVNPRTTVRMGILGKLKNVNDLIGFRTRDLPACSIMPQPTTLSQAIQHRILGLTKDGLGRIWKETTLISYRYYRGICMEGLTNPQSTSVQIANVAKEIRAKDLQSRTAECNRYSSLLGMYRRFGDALPLL